MGDGERRVDKKGLDGGRDRDGGSDAGKKEAKEEGREGGLTTRRGNHTVEFQLDFKLMQVGSKIQRTFG